MAFSINDYEDLVMIGAGGFGSVYRARQKSLGRTVAIKSLCPHRAQSRNEIIRFGREAQAMATLSHDNIISIYDYAHFSGSYYIVMEFIDGVSFDTALRENIPLESSVLVMERVCCALSYAHKHNIIHRDIKPANIFLSKSAQIKLADFGLALLQKEMTTQSTSSAIGTLAYMAPEVMISPADIDNRADTYSLGCVLYEVLSGSPPFTGESIGEISYKVLNENPPAPAVAQKCYEPVAALAMKCLNKQRSGRPSMEEVHDTLSEIVRGTGSGGTVKIREMFGGDAKNSVLPVILQPGNKQPSPLSFFHRRKVVKKICLGAAGAILAVTAAAYLLSYYSSTQVVSEEPFLLLQEQMLSTNLAKTLGRSDAGQADDNEPMPLVQGVSELKTGVVIVNGTLEGDTFVLNGDTMSVSADGDETLFTVTPGLHDLNVYRSDGTVLSKEINIMPYQKWQWNL